MGHVSIEGEYKLEAECYGYMLGVEWLYHLGNDVGGAPIYPSIGCLYESNKYANEVEYPQDGIVEVKIKFLKHIPAEKCWDAKNEEERVEIIRASHVKRAGYVDVGNCAIRADILIQKLKDGGYL